jgi:predicted cobalt transporter CbtA
MANQPDMTPENPRMPLTRKNYIILAIGFAVVLLGFVLMAGGGSHWATEFNYDMFSFRRITLAPILVVGGFVVEIYGILKRY